VADDVNYLIFDNMAERNLAFEENKSIPIVKLRSDISEIKDKYVLENYKIKYNKVDGSRGYQLILPEGRVIFTEWEGKVHEINYQISVGGRDRRIRKLKYLFKEFQGTVSWIFDFDNGFGKFYKSSDGAMQGMWAYQMDVITFVTQELYEQPKSSKK